MASRMHLLSVGMSLYLTLASSGSLYAADKPKPSVNDKLTRVSQQLLDNGHKTCIPQLDQIVKWVHEDDHKYGLHAIWSETTPDLRTATTITFEPETNGSSAITTFTSTLDKTGKCSVIAIQSFTTLENCTVTRDTVFSDWKYIGKIASTSFYHNQTDGTLLRKR